MLSSQILRQFTRKIIIPTKCTFSTKQKFITSRLFTTSKPVSILNEEEEMLRSSVARFANEKIKPKVMQMDKSGSLDKNLLDELFQQGYMSMEIPVEHGGVGANFFSSILLIEELAKVDPGIAVIVDIQNTLINTIISKFGNPDQKKYFLPKLATNYVGSFCLSEASSGSDAFALKTKAQRSGNEYIINGTKLWISNAPEAKVFVVMANIDHSQGYKGITAFLVEKGNPGLQVGKKEDKLGIRSSSTCEVNFVDCKVHKDMILGELGKGYKIAIESLNEGRIGIAAQMLGLAEGAFEYAMAYMHQRVQFGQKIADFQGMQFQYADVATQIEAAKLLVYNAARLKENDLPFVQEAAMAKWYSARVAELAASKGVEWLGGVGFTKEFASEKYYRDCKIGAIYEGTHNIMAQTIAKNIQKRYK